MTRLSGPNMMTSTKKDWQPNSAARRTSSAINLFQPRQSHKFAQINAYREFLKRRKPLWCQAITVAALTMKIPDRHSLQTADSQTHSSRSAAVSFGRFTDRCRIPSWWRRARISTCRAVRLRNDAKRVADSAEIVGTHGNRKKNDNPQFISHFEVYENYSRRSRIRLGCALVAGVLRNKSIGKVMQRRFPIDTRDANPSAVSLSDATYKSLR